MATPSPLRFEAFVAALEKSQAHGDLTHVTTNMPRLEDVIREFRC